MRILFQTIIYDKAKYHYEGDFPQELPMEQAFVHTGMFLGWVIDNNLFKEITDNGYTCEDIYRMGG